MSELVVAASVAEDEFQRFADAMDLDVDVERMDKDDRDAFGRNKRRITRAIELGRLVIDDKGQPVYTPQNGATITFYEPSGASLLSMDKKKDGENVAKTYATMADMTRTSAERFSSMPARDLKICQSLYLLFLA